MAPALQRLAGIVRSRSGKVAILSATLETPSGQRSARPQLGWFDLERPDGTQVAIEVEGVTTLLPMREREARWGELEQQAGAQPFLAEGPGPEVRVTLTDFVLHDGERVELLAEPREGDFVAEGALPRQAAQREVTMRAVALARGNKAAELIDQHQQASAPPPADALVTQPRAGRGLEAVLLGLALALLAAALLLAFRRVGLRRRLLLAEVAGVVVALGMSVLLLRHLRLGQPRCFAPEERRDSRARAAGQDWQLLGIDLPSNRFLAAAAVAIIGMVGVPVLGVGNLGSHLEPDVDRVAFIIWGLWLLLCTALLWWGGQSPGRVARLMLRAAPLPASAPDGTWGAIEGKLRFRDSAASVMGLPSALYAAVTVTVHRRGTSSQARGPAGIFQVDGPQRAVTVTPELATWAGVHLAPRPQDAAGGVTYAEAVPGDGAVLVVGRVQGGALSARERDSLFVVATEAGARLPPRALLHGFLLRRRALLGLLLGLALGFFVLAALVPWRQL